MTSGHFATGRRRDDEAHVMDPTPGSMQINRDRLGQAFEDCGGCLRAVQCVEVQRRGAAFDKALA